MHASPVEMETPNGTVETLLNSVLAKIGLGSNIQLQIRPVSARLWLSNAYTVKITLEDGKEVSLFLKSLPGDVLRKELFDSPAYFRNEVTFYNDVMPAFLDFQKSRIGIEEAFNAVPHCYHAYSDGNVDIIVLQDMKAKGFVIPNRLKMLGLPELHLVMRELGRFHAVSLAMKHQEPEKFWKLKDSLEETVWNERFIQKMGKRMYTETCEDAIRLVKESHPDNSKYVEELQRLRDNMVATMTHQVTSQEPVGVITHGDFWVNNFLFQYSEPDVLERLCFLDFQQSRYASPALDLGSALYMCMDKTTRAHKDSLLRSYHDSLGELMRALGSDPDEVFPYERMEEEIAKYSFYGLANAFMNIPQTMDVHEAGVDEMGILAKLSEAENTMQDIVEIIFSELEKPFCRKTEECKQRLLDVIVEVVDLGYFKYLPS